MEQVPGSVKFKGIGIYSQGLLIWWLRSVQNRQSDFLPRGCVRRDKSKALSANRDTKLYNSLNFGDAGQTVKRIG